MDSFVNKTPHVTVFMPVYNAGRFLEQAMRSILRQTYKDFEFLIIDDGSGDDTAQIIARLSDTRIRLIRHETNLGMLASFNEGIRESRGEFIARMDSDDVAHPSRLEKQVEFLNTHPDFVLLGTSARIIDENGKPTGVKWVNRTKPEKMPAVLLFNNCFTHPSVMIRKSALPEPAFRTGLTPAEDYDLWIRLAERGKLWNLPDVLMDYRVHGTNISKKNPAERKAAVRTITRGNLKRFGIDPTEDELTVHRTNYTYDGWDVDEFLEKRERWLKRLAEKNDAAKLYPPKLFREVAAEKWLNSCSSNARLGLRAWDIFWKSDFSEYLEKKTNAKNLFKFFLKSLLGSLRRP